MTAVDWLKTAWLLIVIASLLILLLIVLALDDRRKRRDQQQSERPMSPAEFYVIREVRKREVLRHLRAVARQHGRPAARQRRNHQIDNNWR